MGSIQENFDIDQAALKAKYREERDKRLRDDGIAQYREVEESTLKHYADDPYTKFTPRDTVDEEVEFLIVGGGFGGQILTVRLMEAGITNVRIVEKAGDFGGTWYWNRYPGAMCDVESYIYMPLCEEMDYMPTEKYAKAPELWEYSRKIGRRFGLYEKTLFQAEVNNLDWDEAAGRWTAQTTRGDRIRARFVTTASGPLHKPKLPGVKGIESYRGHSFHTSRWDYEYTGGDTHAPLDKISDKRIGIIGTGATAIQAIPPLGRGAGHLYVFQRTPSSIDVRNNRPTDPEWASKLTAGWQQRRMDNFNTIVTGGHQDEDLVGDGWTDIFTTLFNIVDPTAGDAAKKDSTDKTTAKDPKNALQIADFVKMSQIRARVDSLVKDPETANGLKPWYNQFCKRPCFHDEYLQTFNRPNVTLVDTQGRGIESITEKGIVANGKEIELDAIIYSTGFEFSTDFSQKMRTTITGRDGLTLSEHWKDGTRTLHGLHARGFPNLFIISIAQSGWSVNFTHMLNVVSKHIALIVNETNARGARTVEASQEAEEGWVQTILDTGKFLEDFRKECTPGYYNYEGKMNKRAAMDGQYGLGCPAFIKLLHAAEQTGTLPGLELDGKSIEQMSTLEMKEVQSDLVKAQTIVTVESLLADETASVI